LALIYSQIFGVQWHFLIVIEVSTTPQKAKTNYTLKPQSIAKRWSCLPEIEIDPQLFSIDAEVSS